VGELGPGFFGFKDPGFSPGPGGGGICGGKELKGGELHFGEKKKEIISRSRETKNWRLLIRVHMKKVSKTKATQQHGEKKRI